MLQELYIVRHGHPQQGTGLLYDRVPGPMLSEVGRAEAQVTAQFLLNRGIEQVYVSPLDRTLGTARVLVAALGVPMRVEEALAEHRSDEKFEGVKLRVRDFLARVECEPLTNVAFVTHGSPMKALLQVLSHDTIDLSKHIYPNGNHAPTAGVWHARRDLFGAWQLDLVYKPIVATPTTHIPI
jgi:broad specificity phosphatase PhoE